MKSWNRYLEEAGYHNLSADLPKVEVKYYSYKEGKVSEHDSERKALEVSSNIERVETVLSLENRRAFSEAKQKALNVATEAWRADLRQKYYSLPDSVYSICYNRAYEINDSAGYNGVASLMIREAEFAKDILAAYHKC